MEAKGRWATVSTSSDNRRAWKIALRYVFVAAFLALFNFVYGLFAHGVSSLFMQLAFLIPLVGGGGVSLLFLVLPSAGDVARSLWRMGITTLSVGFLLHGVFDIYGSIAPLVNVFFLVAGILFVTATATYLLFDHPRIPRV